MNIIIHKNKFGDRDYFVCLPASYLHGDKRYPVVYVQDGDRLLPVLEDMFDSANGTIAENGREHIIVGVIPQNRLDDYTPWPASALTDGVPAFGGLGEQYLDFLANGLKPYIDDVYRTLPDPVNTCILGVSLGGLISLYAIYKQACFGCAVSISGSLWYPSLIDFMQKHAPCSTASRVLLLSGRMEGAGDPPPLHHSVQCVQQVQLILEQQLFDRDIPLIWDDGGHMDNLHLRFKKALQWIGEVN